MVKTKRAIAEIESLLSNEFQKELLKASFRNLEDDKNALSFNNFAYSIRELARHILDSLAPVDDVMKCDWFNIKEAHKDKPTRKQKVKYAIQGVLKDEFVDKQIIPLSDIKDAQDDIIQSIDMLSKYTHINEDTFDISLDEKDEKSNQVIESFISFATLIWDCRENVEKRTEEFIEFNIFEAAIYEVIDDIDILATHHNIEEVNVNSATLKHIKEDEITYEIGGTLEVRLQWGSDGDMRRGDGHEVYESFFFSCIANVQLGASDYSHIYISNVKVDTDEYWGIEELTDEEVDRLVDIEIEKEEKKCKEG